MPGECLPSAFLPAGINGFRNNWHRITEWLRLAGASGDYLVQSLAGQGQLQQVAQNCIQPGF